MLEIPEKTKIIESTPYNVPVTLSYELKNIGDTPLFIENTGAGCGCTVPSLNINPIPPHSSGFLNLVYSANSQGRNSKQAWVIVDKIQHDVFFTANVV